MKEKDEKTQQNKDNRLQTHEEITGNRLEVENKVEINLKDLDTDGFKQLIITESENVLRRFVNK